MDKNTITGFVLIAAVLIGFSWWNQPSEEQMAQMRQQDSLQEVARKKAEETKKAAQLAATEKKAQKLAQAQQDTTALFHSALSGNAQQVVLKNKKLELCEKAEALKDSTDWKETSAIMAQLQKEWN